VQNETTSLGYVLRECTVNAVATLIELLYFMFHKSYFIYTITRVLCDVTSFI